MEIVRQLLRDKEEIHLEYPECQEDSALGLADRGGGSYLLTRDWRMWRAVKLNLCLGFSSHGVREGHDLNADGIQAKDQRIPFQIFPEPVEAVPAAQPCSVNHMEQEKERLPSIVVEPTEVSEVESGELRWPPENCDLDEDEEDLFLEQCIPPANIADWGEEEEEEEETSVIFNPQPGLTLIDLQSDAFRDDTPTLPPSNASAFN